MQRIYLRTNKNNTFGSRNTLAHQIPWDIHLSQNQVYNRAFIEVAGFSAWKTLLSRNHYERLEKVLESSLYLLMEVGTPLLLGYYARRGLLRYFKQYNPSTFINKRLYPKRLPFKTPIDLPFEFLGKVLQQPNGKRLAPVDIERLHSVGLKGLPKSLTQSILNAKYALLTTNLSVIGVSNLLMTWGRNALTEKLSGKGGFSGVYNIVSPQYHDKVSNTYKKQLSYRFIASVATAMIGAISLPIAISLLIRSNPARGSLLHGLKKSMTLFNNTEGTFISKYSLLWMYLTNYNTSLVLASRDKNELRETLVDQAATDFFYFFGDDIISGFAAKALQAKYKKQLKGITLWRGKKCGIPLAIAFEDVYRASKLPAQKLANQLSRVVFWSGILGTALIMGISITLGNNWYTHHKVKQEEH